MQIVSTDDVSLRELSSFAGELDADLDVAVDKSQVSLRAADPSSWVTLLAEANWWKTALAGAATLYVAELVKEAAKESWRNRSKAVAVVKDAGNRVYKLALAIAALRRRLSEPTTLGIGFPIPNKYFSTRLRLRATEADELALELSLFIHHVPALAKLIEDRALSEAATGVFLELKDDGALLVAWHDRQTLEVCEHVIEL